MHLGPHFPIPHEPGAVSTPSLYYVQTLQNKGSRHECGESGPVEGVHRADGALGLRQQHTGHIYRIGGARIG